MVLDADALNILSVKPALLAKVPAGSILTPHPGEFKRLVGEWQNDFDKLEKLLTLAQRLKSAVVLKGAYSAIALADGSIYFNSTGNPEWQRAEVVMYSPEFLPRYWRKVIPQPMQH